MLCSLEPVGLPSGVQSANDSCVCVCEAVFYQFDTVMSNDFLL
jgi:hypothetical protein